MLQDDDDTKERPQDENLPQEEVRMTQFVLGEIRRYVMLVMGIVFLIIGAIVLPLPLPFGLAMILIGLSILIVNSTFIRRKFLALRSRWTRMDEWLRSVEHRLPAPLRKAITPDEQN